jgi:hypothetical protein
MLSNDFYVFDAGWLFFAAWTVILVVVTVTAFARDLFPPHTQLRPAQQNQSSPSASPNSE